VLSGRNVNKFQSACSLLNNKYADGRNCIIFMTSGPVAHDAKIIPDFVQPALLSVYVHKNQLVCIIAVN
jgi:hypothetical protein